MNVLYEHNTCRADVHLQWVDNRLTRLKVYLYKHLVKPYVQPFDPLELQVHLHYFQDGGKPKQRDWVEWSFYQSTPDVQRQSLKLNSNSTLYIMKSVNTHVQKLLHVCLFFLSFHCIIFLLLKWKYFDILVRCHCYYYSKRQLMSTILSQRVKPITKYCNWLFINMY